MLTRIKGCVGERNYKYFLGFILSHSLMCLYGFLVALQVVLRIIREEKLWTTKFKNHQTGVEYDAGLRIVFLYMMAHYNWLVFLVVICFVMFIALMLFFVYHLYQINRGLSTSENAKVSGRLRSLGYRMSDLISRCEKSKDMMSKEQMDECREQIKICEHTAVMVMKLYDQRNLSNNLKTILAS